MQPSEYPAERYGFQSYTTKHRMLTYWYQICEILTLRPASVLEIGVGSGLVAAYLRSLGIQLKTIDINPRLRPDYVGSVLNLDHIIAPATSDLVLCARVLHHLDFKDFGLALEQIAYATRKYAVITLPFEDFRFYLMFRYTSSKIRTFSLALPLPIKRALLWCKLQSNQPRFSSLWKIEDSKLHSLRNVRTITSGHFDIIADYRIPEDSAHYVAVLQKKAN